MLLIVSGVCYMIDTTAFFLFPDAKETIAAIIGLPQALGEISMVLWLVIKGASEQNQINHKPALAIS